MQAQKKRRAPSLLPSCCDCVRLCPASSLPHHRLCIGDPSRARGRTACSCCAAAPWPACAASANSMRYTAASGAWPAPRASASRPSAASSAAGRSEPPRGARSAPSACVYASRPGRMPGRGGRASGTLPYLTLPRGRRVTQGNLSQRLCRHCSSNASMMDARRAHACRRNASAGQQRPGLRAPRTGRARLGQQRQRALALQRCTAGAEQCAERAGRALDACPCHAPPQRDRRLHLCPTRFLGLRAPYSLPWSTVLDRLRGRTHRHMAVPSHCTGRVCSAAAPLACAGEQPAARQTGTCCAAGLNQA